MILSSKVNESNKNVWFVKLNKLRINMQYTTRTQVHSMVSNIIRYQIADHLWNNMSMCWSRHLIEKN